MVVPPLNGGSSMNRRHFLATALASTLTSLAAQEKRPRRLLLRSSWQTVNIGDIAHTPGVLHLLEEHLPGVEVRLSAPDDRLGLAVLRANPREPNLVADSGAGLVATAHAQGGQPPQADRAQGLGAVGRLRFSHRGQR